MINYSINKLDFPGIQCESSHTCGYAAEWTGEPRRGDNDNASTLLVTVGGVATLIKVGNALMSIQVYGRYNPVFIDNNNFDVEILGLIKYSNPNELETYLHSKFKHKQVIFRGEHEWFDLTSEEIEEINLLAQSIMSIDGDK